MNWPYGQSSGRVGRMVTTAPRTTGDLAVEASGLTKAFGRSRALDGVDLAIPRGSVYGVLGPNGAGKTTTIRILATLLRPDSGSARVLGHDVVREAAAVRSRVEPDGTVRVGRRGPHCPREPRAARPAPRLFPQAGEGARTRAARGVRPRRGGGPPGPAALGRHAPPARHRGQHHRHARPAVPRRADDRPGPAQPQPRLGDRPRDRRARARRSCSPRSTSTRPIGWPTGSP